MSDTLDDSERERLLAIARRAAMQAYAPYSRFRVGAAVVVATPDGSHIVTGANVENASFGLSLCAERSALATACSLTSARRPAATESRVVSAPTITQVAIACVDAPANAPANERMPCGACRQWFAELAPDAIFYIDGVTGDLTLTDLLPHPFQLSRDAPDPSDH